MKDSVLVTGATGFTGTHLCRRLINEGRRVRALARSSSNVDSLKSFGVEVYSGDVTKFDTLQEAVRGIQIVYHLAALYRQEGVPKKEFWNVHVTGTQNVLEASMKGGVERVVHCSTVGVQGAIANPPAKETDPYNPGDEYQRTKMEGEKLALQFFEKHNFPGVVVRPVGVYGPGDMRFLKLFKHIQNRKFMMFGNGAVLYHLTHVDDLAAGIILSGEKNEAVGQVYTIAGNEFVTLNQLVGLIAQCLKVPVPRWRLPFWPLWAASLSCEILCKPFGIEPPLYRRRADFFRKDRAFVISKVRKELGFSPKIDLATGLQLTADWYKQHGYLKA